MGSALPRRLRPQGADPADPQGSPGNGSDAAVSVERFSVPGKWVLAGEHTVLRGGRAVALPHPSFGLELEFTPGERFEVFPRGAEEVIQGLFSAIGAEA